MSFNTTVYGAWQNIYLKQKACALSKTVDTTCMACKMAAHCSNLNLSQTVTPCIIIFIRYVTIILLIFKEHACKIMYHFSIF